MNRSICSLLLLSAVLSWMSCKSEDVSISEQISPTPEPTPTMVPEPTFSDAEMAYHITSMVVGSSRSTSIDIDGDGNADSGFEDALNEIVKFVGDLVGGILDQLVEAGKLDETAAKGLKLTIQTALKSILNVDTFNAGLATMLQTQNWLQILDTQSTGEASLEFWTSTDAGDGYWSTSESLGDALTGTLDINSGAIDASGQNIALAIPLASSGAEPVMFDAPLQQTRDIQTYTAGQPLEGAILGGGISIASLEDLINNLMRVVGVFGVMPESSVDAMKADVESTLDGMADIQLKSGEPAISMCLFYSGDYVQLW